MTASACSWAGLRLPAELMEAGRIGQGHRQAQGVRQLLGQGQGLVAPPQGLVRIAQAPTAPGAA